VVATGATGVPRGDRGLTNHEALKEADMATATVQQAPGLFRTDIQHSALSVPGRVAIQNRVEIHPEAPFVWHKHPGEEIIYVIEGALEYHLEGQEPFTVEAGEGFTVPSETVHAVRTAGSEPGFELATYVVDKDKPFLVVVQK
jgi:quercetin dioxygenase-like cupin family protein